MSDKVIIHYGVKGMQWGVRKGRSVATAFLTGNPKTSLLHPGGRANAKKDIARMQKSSGYKAAKKAAVIDGETSLLTKKGRENAKKDAAKGKAALSKVTNSKLFKTTIFDKDTSVLTSAGRSKLQKQIKTSKAKKAAAKKERVKATKKLIKDLVADDGKMAKKWGKKYDAAEATKYWEKLFESDLQG